MVHISYLGVDAVGIDVVGPGAAVAVQDDSGVVDWNKHGNKIEIFAFKQLLSFQNKHWRPSNRFF